MPTTKQLTMCMTYVGAHLYLEKNRQLKENFTSFLFKVPEKEVIERTKIFWQFCRAYEV